MTRVRFPDGTEAEVDETPQQIGVEREEVCAKCAGLPQPTAFAASFTVVLCPRCGIVHPGSAIQ